MSRLSMVLTAMAWAFLSAGSQAQVVRCADAAGKVIYTDQPCTGAQASREVKTYAGPPVQASVPSSTTEPKLSAEAAAHEQKRQEKRAQSGANQQRIDDALAKVRQIRADNVNPAKCAEAKRRMSAMESAGRDTLLLVKADPDYFHYQQLASLHCGN